VVRLDHLMVSSNSRAICFDLDGTLTDPELGITRSIRHALSVLGHPVPDHDDLVWCIGPPLLGSLEQLLGDRRDRQRPRCPTIATASATSASTRTRSIPASARHLHA